MEPREHVHLVLVIVVSVIIKLSLFHEVGVFGDYGFWAYDSRLILHGQTPYVDFPGRSPLMVYLLAFVRDVIGSIPVTFRLTIIALWTVTAIPVYLLGRRIRSHRTGLVSTGFLLLMPFGVVYGMWLNSQALAALLGVTGVLVVYSAVDSRQRLEHVGFAIAGVLLGGAFLARRSSIVLLAAIGLWTLYYYRTTIFDPSTIKQYIGNGVVVATGFLVTISTGYVLVSGFNASVAWGLFNLDFVGLFASQGRGAYPLLGVDVPTASARIKGGGLPVINDLCPACGAWTARRGLKMLLHATPVIGIGLLYAKDVLLRYYSVRERQYVLGAITPLVLYAIYLALWHGFIYRALGLISLTIFAIVAWKTPIDRDVLYHPGLVLILITIGVLIMGYLYRDRRLLVYYMMDLWPYYAILGGILTAWVWDQHDLELRTVLAVAIVIGVLVSVFTAGPLVEVGLSDETHWFTITTLTEYSQDLDARTTPTDRVLSPHPTYIAGSGAFLVYNNSRLYAMAIVNNNESAPIYGSLYESMLSGEISYIVVEGLARDVLYKNTTVHDVFESEYCPVDTDVYDRTNATLYTYCKAS